MDRDARLAAVQWLAQRQPAVVVEVTEAKGSAPRAAGTRMLVAAAQTVGTIGGGHLELKAIQSAREMLRTQELAPHSEHYPLGPALGQCCGGAVTLGFAALDDAALARWPAAPPMFHLQLYGAGHVGRAIATLLATLDVVVDWIDEREEEFASRTTLGTPWPSHIRQVCVDAVDAEVREAPPGAYYLVLTHNHDLDLRITEAILRRGDFGFLGLIGSRTKRQRFIHRYEQRGIAPDVIARMTCPIGVEGITGKQPEIIAVGVVAQLLQAHQGNTSTLRSTGLPAATYSNLDV
ncbi:xanthine dehydrogenase accessory protein XdhC [Piscinibacter sp.]|jgi:xanthine dehydrogenase accessory factor|uniref:xanthine dehydrogenase accessory protein XdhC n=1 Tax=Piscinibacter sp. TaxID=1903157 RepID=UPI00355A7EA2